MNDKTSDIAGEKRAGEEHRDEVPDRSDRVFQDGEYWYFHTREGAKIGPFDTQELALTATNDYVGFAIDAEPELLDSISSTTEDESAE